MRSVVGLSPVVSTIEDNESDTVDRRVVRPGRFEFLAISANEDRLHQRAFSHSKSPVNSIKREIDRKAL